MNTNSFQVGSSRAKKHIMMKEFSSTFREANPIPVLQTYQNGAKRKLVIAPVGLGVGFLKNLLGWV